MRTVLRRLEAKGYVTHSVDGRTFLYRAVHPPVSVATRAVRQLIDRFCGGSAEALVVGLVNDDVLSEQAAGAYRATGRTGQEGTTMNLDTWDARGAGGAARPG